jgi:hypothetical protein
MKIIKNIAAIIMLFAAFSCQKHVVEYNAVNINGKGFAEFDLNYFVPLVVTDDNYVYKMELDGKAYEIGTWSADSVYTPGSFILNYNLMPSGAGRFYTTTTGSHNLKLYISKNFTQVYDQNVTLAAGKQNVFVYDFTKPPIVFQQEFPYPTETTERTDTSGWVKFYNFMFETGTTPTTLKLQYQYRYVRRNISLTDTSAWINLGKPVSFGEATGWERITIIKTTEISQGSSPIFYRIRMIGTDGSDQGDLQVMNANSAFVNYTSTITETIGNVQHHILKGHRASTTPVASMTEFVAK